MQVSGLVIFFLFFASGYFLNTYYKQHYRNVISYSDHIQKDVSDLKKDISDIKKDVKSLNIKAKSESTRDNLLYPKYIHFVETTTGSMHLSALQQCSVESAKKHNPLSQVIVWSFEQKMVPNGIENKVIDWRVKASKYFNVSNLEKKLSTDSRFRIAHLSDICRYMILMEHGGLYLDIDTIMVDRYVPMNKCMISIVRQDGEKLANGVIYADRPGHPVFDNSLYKLDEVYNGNDWETIGPTYISHHVKYQCNLNSLANVSKCKHICIYPADTFYPFSWDSEEIKNIYSEKSANYNISTNTIGVHVFNKITSSLSKKIDSESLFAKLAHLNCPNVEI